jgi:mannose-6-phosphate isomerase
LLLKFLDAADTLSVQVHPDDARAALFKPPECGKSEAWVVLDAAACSVIYAGLRPGVDRTTLEAAIREGRCRDCLHELHPSAGDCIFLPAGTVHALGAGLLVAEIQQPSDVTYRLFDWNRVGPDGRPRPLHVEQGLAAIDFDRGPVEVQRPLATKRPEVSRLVECEKFILDRWDFDSPLLAGGDNRCHVIAVLHGAVTVAGDPAGIALPRGGTALLPAWQAAVEISPIGRSILLDAYLP